MADGEFRLSLLLSPAYLRRRLATIHSPRELGGRMLGLCRYCLGLAVNSAYAARAPFIRGAAAVSRAAGGTGVRCRLAAARAYGASRTFMSRSAALAAAAFKTADAAARLLACAAAVPGIRLSRALSARRRAAALEAGLAALSPAGFRKDAPPNPPAPFRLEPPRPRRLLWLTHLGCNYRCPYCWTWTPDSAPPALPDNFDARAWGDAWDAYNARFGPAELELLGGEPFLLPGMPGLLDRLCRNNKVLVFTNLSWDPSILDGFSNRGSLAIAASYHPSREPDPAGFIDRIMRLRRAGIFVTAYIVAWPPYMEKLAGWLDAFYSAGIYTLAEPFRGRWNGMKYPDSYTGREAALLESIASGRHFRPYAAAAVAAGWPDPLPGGRLAASMLSTVMRMQFDGAYFRGRACNAGFSYVRVLPDGGIARCAGGGELGNVLSGEYRFQDGPAACSFPECGCMGENFYVSGGPLGPPASAAGK